MNPSLVTPSDLALAQKAALLLGGNGLTTDQQVALIAQEVAAYRVASCFRAADIMVTNTADIGLIRSLVWYRHGGEDHGHLPETWKEHARELEGRVVELEFQLNPPSVLFPQE